MLKSKGLPSTPVPIQTPANKPASRLLLRPSSPAMPMPPMWMRLKISHNSHSYIVSYNCHTTITRTTIVTRTSSHTTVTQQSYIQLSHNSHTYNSHTYNSHTLNTLPSTTLSTLSIDPAAGSPTAAMLRLISYLTDQTQTSQSSSTMSSQISTGGVYKGQGPIQSHLMNGYY
jgi:hypothetical protein